MRARDAPTLGDQPAERDDRPGLTLGLESGTVERGGRRFAEAAVPVQPNGPFLLLSVPLQDTVETVDYVRQSLLIAGLLAFGGALLVGFTGASIFARRIRRLERAADRIAAGRFDEPIVDHRSDDYRPEFPDERATTDETPEERRDDTRYRTDPR